MFDISKCSNVSPSNLPQNSIQYPVLLQIFDKIKVIIYPIIDITGTLATVTYYY